MAWCVRTRARLSYSCGSACLHACAFGCACVCASLRARACASLISRFACGYAHAEGAVRATDAASRPASKGMRKLFRFGGDFATHSGQYLRVWLKGSP
eukprot:6214347-Pleurochrysis_carterae.AAC.1